MDVLQLHALVSADGVMLRPTIRLRLCLLQHPLVEIPTILDMRQINA